MYYVFNHSSKGYQHIQENKPCQDFSTSYSDNERTIISVSDGHGGSRYVRSDVGAKLACRAVNEVLQQLSYSALSKSKLDSLDRVLRLATLCKWNELVEHDLRHNHLRKSELANLSEHDLLRLKEHPEIAYGATLAGALLIKNKIVVISIGDTEVLGVKKGESFPLFDDTDEPVANVTYSLCSEDAYEHIRVKVIDSKLVDGIILCSDGLVGPYRTYSSFNHDFIKEEFKHLLVRKTPYFFTEIVDNLASQSGTGDDVSLAFLFNNDTNERWYR